MSASKKNKLILRKGRYYRTRGGRKARIYATDGGGSWPVHGAFNGASYWVLSAWNSSGTSILTAGLRGDQDLVAPWRGPRTNRGMK